MKNKPYWDYLKSLSSNITPINQDDLDEQFCWLMTLREDPENIRILLKIFRNTFG